MKIVALYSAGTTVSWQTARRRNTFHPLFPFVRHPSVCPSTFAFYNTRNTEHGTKTKTNQRINATNTRGEEWLIENLYHPVWYSFISGIYTGIIDSILHMCIILKHASTLRTVETVFFSLSLASIPERND